MGLFRTGILSVVAASLLAAGAVAQPLAPGAPAGHAATTAAALPLPVGHSAGLLLAQQIVGGGFLGGGIGGLVAGVAMAIAIGDGQSATNAVSTTGTSA
jgi:hypothetical protein